MIQIDVAQGGKRPSIPVTVKKPVSVVVTPKQAPKPVKTNPVPVKPKATNILDIIIGGVLPIAINPVIPGIGLPLLPPLPDIKLPSLPAFPDLGLPALPDLKLPGLPAFPDLGLPNIGKWFDDLKSGAGLVLLGIGGLIALLIITRK